MEFVTSGANHRLGRMACPGNVQNAVSIARLSSLRQSKRCPSPKAKAAVTGLRRQTWGIPDRKRKEGSDIADWVNGKEMGLEHSSVRRKITLTWDTW